MASKVNALAYMRNVGRSLGYSVVDNITEMNPTVASLVNTTKEQTQNLYHNIKDFKANARDFGNTGPLADAKEIGRESWNNLLSDLKSGNWYNKARVEKMEEDVMGDMLGINFDDFGDLDFDFDDDEAKEKVDMENESIKKTAQVIDAVGQKTSAAIASASVHSADYIVRNTRASSKALFDLNSKGFSTVISGISAINANVGILVEMGKPLTEHMQNSALFYAKSNEYQEQSLALLKQIAKNTAPKTGVGGRKGSDAITLIDLINSDGTINMSNIKKAAKQGYESSMLGMVTSMLGMVGGVKTTGKMFAASPLQMVLNGLTGQMFNIKGSKGRTARDAMGDFNDLLAGFLPAMLGKFQAADINKMKLPDWMKSLLKGVRGNLPSSGMTRKINTGNYEKGPVDWDGMSRKALMDVIPTQLSQILSALTGEEPQMFDYKTGRWVKVHSINRMNRERTNRYGNQAGGELFSDIRRSIQNSNSMSKRGKKEYDAQIQAFLNQLLLADDADFMRFISNGNFDVNKYKDYIHPDLLNDLRKRARMLARSNSKYTSSYARNMYSARAGYGREMRNLGGSGDITELLYNGAFGDLNNRPGGTRSMSTHNQSKMRDGRLGGIYGGFGGAGSNLIATVDQYDHNIFYYMQELHKDVNFIATNLDMLVPGGRPIGSKEQGAVHFKPRLVLKPRDASDAAKRNIPRSVFKGPRNVPTGSVEEVLNNGEDPRYKGLTQEEIDYLKAKEKGGPKFQRNQKLEDSIEGKQGLQGVGKNTRQKISDTYGKMKKSKMGTHLTNLEELAGVSTDAVVNILDAASTQINNFMYGTGKPGEETFASVLKNSFSSMFSQMAKTITDLIPGPVKELFAGLKRMITQSEMYKNFKSGVKNQFKEWGMGLFTGWGGSQKGSANRRRMENTVYGNGSVPNPNLSDADLWAMGELEGMGSGLNNFYSRLNDDYDSIYLSGRNGWAAGGSYDYDEPVVIPFSRSRSRSRRRRRMSGGASGSFRDDDAAAGPSRRMYREYKKNKAKGQTATEAHRNAKDSAGVAMERIIARTSSKLANWISSGLSEIMGGNKPEDEKKQLQSNIDKSMKSMLKDAKVGKDAIGAGALLGAGVGLFTSALVGPIGGAAIGAGIGFISKSETAQKLLFGEIDEDGDRKGGFFNKKMSNFLTKNLPQMGKGAALGSAAGLLLGSPFVGAIVGSGMGFVASSENAKKWLFGEMDEETGERKGGFIPKKLQDFIKKKAPWAVAGGAAGLLMGPFGPLGNLVAGSMLGLASQTEGFKKWMFGDKKGKFGEGGFSELIKNNLMNPIVDLFKNMTTAITEKIKEVTHNLAKTIRGFIYKRLHSWLSKSKTARKVADFGKKAVKGAFNLATAPVRGISNAVRKHNIRKGRTAFLNGEEMDVEARNQYREDNMLFGGNAIMEGFDRDVLSEISGDNEKLAELKSNLQSLYDPSKVFQERYKDNRANLSGAFNSAIKGTQNKDADKMLRKIYKKYLNKGNYISSAEHDKASEEIKALKDYGIDPATISSLIEQVDALRKISIDEEENKAGNSESAVNSVFDKMGKSGNFIKDFYTSHRKNLTDTEISRMMGLIDVEMNKNNKNNVIKTPEEETKDLTAELNEETKKQTNVVENILDTLDEIAKSVGVDPAKLHRNTSESTTEETSGEKEDSSGNEDTNFSDAVEEASKQAEEARNSTTSKSKISTKIKSGASKLGSKIGSGVKKAGSTLVKGVGKGISSLFGAGGSGDDELFGDSGDDNPDVDSRGEDDTVRDQYGNEVANMGSTEGRKNRDAKASFIAGISSIPVITTGVEKITSLLENMDTKFFGGTGEGGEKKGGILDSISSFFSGGGLLSTLKTAASKFIGPAVGTALIAGVASGKFDKIASKLGLAGRSDSEKGTDSNASFTGMTAEDENGNQVAIAMDENGNPVQDENGNYVSTSGATLDASTVQYTESRATDSLSDRFKRSVTRGGALGVASGVASKLAGGSFTEGLKKGITSRVAGPGMSMITGNAKSWAKAGKAAKKVLEKTPVLRKIVTKVSDLLGKVLEKIAKNIGKFTDAVDDKIAGTAFGKFKQKIIKALEEKAEKSGSKILKKAATDLAATATVILKIALILWDFEEGWNNASANWGVAEPTTGQKIGSGVVHAILNLIPVVGIFIPESLLFDLYANYILPIIDKESAEKLKGQRDEAQAELDAYNEANGTDYSWEEYTKQVKGNYTWGERIENGVKSYVKGAWNDVKSLTGSLASGDFKGAAKTYGNAFLKYSVPGQLVKGGMSLYNKYSGNGEEAPVGEEVAAAEESGGASGLLRGVGGAIKGVSGVAKGIWDKTPAGKAINAFKQTEVGQQVTEGFSKVVSSIKGKIDGFSGDISSLNPTEIMNLQLQDLKSVMVDVRDSSIATSVAKGAVEYVDNVSSGYKKKLAIMTSKLSSKLDQEEAEENASKDSDNNGTTKKKGFFSKIFGWSSSDTKNDKNKTTTEETADESGSGWLAAGSSGMVSQIDPKYANRNIGGRSVGDMGCGPASAVNALNALGRHSSMSSAINNANRYQTPGGTDISYFADEFRRNGAGADYVSGSSMINSVASGRPTVLMGQDRSNTSKARSPFGPKNHYVVANGINSDGSVNISDPETRGVKRYSPSILRHVKMGVAATGSGMSRYARRANRIYNRNRMLMSRYSAGDSGVDNRETIWRYLTKNIGLSEFAAAGIMGCWQAESHNSPARVEGDYLKSFPGIDVVTASPQALTEYTLNILFPAYENSGISINKSAYVAADGQYYPGFGLAQWTGPRTYNLLSFADGNGGDWRELTTQLQFAEQEFNEKYSGTMTNLNNTSSVDEATTIAYHQYEGGKRQDWLNERISYANDIYNTFAGQDYAPVSGLGNNHYNVTGASGMPSDVANKLSSPISSDYWNKKSDASTGSTASTGGTNYSRTGASGMPSNVASAIDNGTSMTSSYSSGETKKSNNLMADILSAFKSAFGLGGSSSSSSSSTGGKKGSSTSGSTSGTSGSYGSTGSSGYTGATYSSGSQASTGGDYETVHNVTTKADAKEKQQALVDKMQSIAGTISYSMSGARNPDAGSADCSSTVNWAYKNILGSDIGSTTLAMLQNTGNLVTIDKSDLPVSGGTGSGPNLDKLEPGDVILLSRPTSGFSSGRPYRVGHVEMYMGNGQTIGHGSGMGPKVKPIQSDKYIMGRRFTDFISDSSDNPETNFDSRGYNTSYDRSKYANTTSTKKTLAQTGGQGMPSSVAAAMSGGDSGLASSSHSSEQQALVDKMKSIEGTLEYSMEGPRDPDQGSADCSSTVNWAYKNILGVDVGSSTPAILANNSNLVTVDQSDLPIKGGTGSGPDLSRLQPGDLILTSRPTSEFTKGRNYRVGHVEMYMGDGQTIGHGKDNGPIPKPIETSKYIMAKRYIGFTDQSGTFNQTGGQGMTSQVANTLTAQEMNSRFRSDFEANRTPGAGAGSGLLNYKGSKAGLKLIRDNSGRFSAGASGQIPSFNGNRPVSAGQFSSSLFGGLGAAAMTPSQQAQVGQAAMSKDTAAMLKVIIDLVSNVVENTANLSEILAVVKQVVSAGESGMKSSAPGIGNAASSFVPSAGVNQATLNSLNDLRTIVDQVLAS